MPSSLKYPLFMFSSKQICEVDLKSMGSITLLEKFL